MRHDLYQSDYLDPYATTSMRSPIDLDHMRHDHLVGSRETDGHEQKAKDDHDYICIITIDIPIATNFQTSRARFVEAISITQKRLYHINR